jgi:hypothetical protein
MMCMRILINQFCTKLYLRMNNLVCYNNKSNNDIFKNPLKFLDLLDKKRKHIVLYYENERFGKYKLFMIT